MQIKVGMYSHSMYSEVLACSGIVGALAFFGGVLAEPLVCFVKHSCRISGCGAQTILLSRIMILIMLSIFLGGVAVVYVYDMYFYVMLGIVAAARKIIAAKS